MPAQYDAARTSPRSRNRRGDGNRLRDEIVTAAGELLSDRGVEALSLRAVARAVGVTAPAVYLHFADKQSLVWAVLERRFADLHDILTRAMAGADDPGRALGAWCRAYVEFAVAHPGHYRVLFESWDARKVDLPLEALPGAAVFASLVEAIAATDAPGDAHETAVLLWAGLHGVASLRINKPSFPWPPAEHLITEMIRRLTNHARPATPSSTHDRQPTERSPAGPAGGTSDMGRRPVPGGGPGSGPGGGAAGRTNRR